MYQKKSLVEAENEAKELSIKFPNTVYYVIDKRNGRAKCFSIDWLAIRYIRYENYFPVCTYQNGIRH